MDNLNIQGITPEMLWVCLFVVIGLCGAISVVLGTWLKIMDVRSRNKKPDTTADIMDKLRSDKIRLDNHDAAINEIRLKQQSLDNGQRVVCAGVMALLDHELHNGNSAQMERASEDINKYLLDK